MNQYLASFKNELSKASTPKEVVLALQCSYSYPSNSERDQPTFMLDLFSDCLDLVFKEHKSMDVLAVITPEVEERFIGMLYTQDARFVITRAIEFEDLGLTYSDDFYQQLADYIDTQSLDTPLADYILSRAKTE